MFEMVLAATGTALATGLGAIPVILLGKRAESLRPLLIASAAGVMIAASVFGLIKPALDRGSAGEVTLGLTLGVLFLVVMRRLLEPGSHRLTHSAGSSSSFLVFMVLFVHSLPEGFAVGTAYATDPATIGIFVVLAIALQNVPEGTSVAIPLASEGASPLRQIYAAVASSALQPVGAVIAFLLVESITGLLPVSFGFAAGAMLALAFMELLPEAFRSRLGMASFGLASGVVVMTALDSLLNV